MTAKTIHTEHGSVRVEQPRDRKGSFEPQIVPKHQRRFTGFDERIIAMYGRGMSVRDIQANLRELYGVDSPGVAVTYFVFDVLAVEGLSTTMQPYSERRALLEQLELETERVRLVATFEDGEALFAAVCERGLEGVVGKRLSEPYRPGERAWVKTKNRATARFAEEREGVRRRRMRRVGSLN